MTTEAAPRVGAVILAAGSSRRLGRPKQLLVFEGEPLITRVAVAVRSVYPVCIVVLGAAADECRTVLAGVDVNTVDNVEWQTGISSSIRIGLNVLQDKMPGLVGVSISLCDQPLVTAEDHQRLSTKFTADSNMIVAASYGGVAGVPAVFPRWMFEQLYQLKGDEGARHLIRRNEARTARVEVPHAVVDIDTQADLNELLRRDQRSFFHPDGA